MYRLKTENSRTTGRKRLAGAVLAAAIGLALVTPQNALAVSLREAGVIEGEAIRLGDIFSGLDRDADKVLGAAPLPGQDMVLNARTLTRIATALDLKWQPSGGQDRIVLRRAATVVDSAMIKETLKNEIAARGLPGKFEVVLPEGQEQQIILPRDAAQSLEITSLSVLPGKDRFEAVIVAPSKSDPIKEARISGTLRRLLDVPVLLDALQGGDVIGRRDIGFIEVPAEAVAPGTVLRAEDLEGMTPRRLLHAGQPVKASEILPPRMVERGKAVTMVFSQSGLTLTAQGKALENGAKGDVVRVVNAASSKTVQATVTGAGEVAIQSF